MKTLIHQGISSSKKAKVIIQSRTSSIHSESETQQDRFGVQTAGQHLPWKLLLLNSNNLISSWLKWLILPGTAWRHSSRTLGCVCDVTFQTGVAHPPSASSGNQGLLQPGTQSKEDDGDATGRTTGQRGWSPALHFWSGSLCSRA